MSLSYEVKREVKRICINGCRCNERLNTKTEGSKVLNTSYTLGWTGRNNSDPCSESSGNAGGTRPGQTRKKPKDLSARESEECGCGDLGINNNY